MKAIILAAGDGNRISSMTDTPKPLLPLDGVPGGITFLDWHVSCLTAAGFEQILIVSSSKTHRAPLKDEYAPVTWILNPTEPMSNSGSAHSAWYAFHSDHAPLDGNSPVLLMDADIVYHPAAIRYLVDSAKSASATLVCPGFDETQEEVLVYGSGDRPVRHGKGLGSTPLARGLTCLGEATGILLLQPQHHRDILAITDWLMRFSTAKTRSEHEDISQRMMDLALMSAVSLPAAMPFMEVDFPHEYETLVATFYPALRERTEKKA